MSTDPPRYPSWIQTKQTFEVEEDTAEVSLSRRLFEQKVTKTLFIQKPRNLNLRILSFWFHR